MKGSFLTSNQIATKHLKTQNFFVGLLFIFFIWPFGAFLLALYHYTKKEYHLIFVLFTGLYGYFMIAESAGLDLYRVLQMPLAYANLSWGEFFNVIGGIYSDDPEASVDIYRDIVAFWVSRFTTKGNILTLVFALIYGFVFIKSISVFIEQDKKKGLYTGIILLSFSFIFPMEQVAGVRYATAAYVFFAGVVKFIETDEKKYLWFVLGAPLIHFSYLSLVMVFGLFFLIRKFSTAIYFILATSFILPEFIGPYIDQFSVILGGAFEQRANLYLLQREAQNDIQQLAWYIRYREVSMFIFSLMVLAFSRIRAGILQKTRFSESVFYFSLLVLSLSNFTRTIPHAGYRLQFIFVMFSTFYLFLLFVENRSNKEVKMLTLLAAPAFFFQIIYGLRNILYTSSPVLYMGNFITFFITDFDQSAWATIFK